MTVQGKQISVSGTVATALVAADVADTSGMEYRIQNSSAGTVFLGAANVAGTTGYRLLPAANTFGHLTKGEAIYGIVTSGTVTCDVFSTGI